MEVLARIFRLEFIYRPEFGEQGNINRFFYFVLLITVVAIFVIGIAVYIGLGTIQEQRQRIEGLETFNQGVLERRKSADNRVREWEQIIREYKEEYGKEKSDRTRQRDNKGHFP